MKIWTIIWPVAICFAVGPLHLQPWLWVVALSILFAGLLAEAILEKGTFINLIFV